MTHKTPGTSSPPASSADAFAVGDLCREFAVTPRALRFYESRGFLAPRRQGLARLYDRTDRDRVEFILKAKRLGFTLRQIGDLLAARSGAAGTADLVLSRRQCTEQINLLEARKRAIEFALAELRRTYSAHYLRSLRREEVAGG